ncbi:hypothetical protein DCCM_2492 [Desulfocucumis palustris]|uniref:Uncharacterized protein n=1 Tax=Desulfocucumis palustris TaxID=1898651 RepID=A0A2L2XHN8_9FIRM|nr:hypothetical protein DCCM_2492 [Desulfocucumis palustris]
MPGAKPDPPAGGVRVHAVIISTRDKVTPSRFYSRLFYFCICPF